MVLVLPIREQQFPVSTFPAHTWRTGPDPDTSWPKDPRLHETPFVPPAWLQQGINVLEGFLCTVAVPGWGGQVKSHNPLPTPRGTREPRERVQKHTGNWVFCQKERSVNLIF